ncbi:hypothetical protein [Symbioplanes lichenis]|uniref:hypothetical protein n=1 Tax=Symbioplanes lichenis TaxID=1629072 RepID=UPI00273A1ED6|nr:hypothetical protein [Actinoplanes lichenis]
MIDLVSNPAWHHDFLCEILPGAAGELITPRVLVSGCADYSLYAHSAFALGGRAAMTTLDWCPTPLAATEWYARRAGLSRPELLLEDAVLHQPEEPYDVIVSDSFLPRFTPEAMRKLVDGWRKSLRDGGTIVTTVRIRSRSGATAGGRGSAVDEWRRRAQDSAPYWNALSTLPHAELVERVVYFAEHQERTLVYEQGDLEDILRLGGFDNVVCRLADINGKRFARIVAS